MNVIRAALMAVVGTCVATAGLLACSSAASNGTGPGADGGGGNDGQVSNADGAMPGVDGSPGGGDGSVATGQGSGLILVTQLVTASAAQSGVTAGFNSTAVVPAGCTKTMVAGCFATSCPVVMGILRSSLNAGTITVTGTGPSSPATLTFGPFGGDAGNVGVTYITDTDNGSKTLSCSFAAAAGTGTVPSAALMMLDVGTAPGFTGVEVISPNNSKTFMVGTLPTLFEAQGSGIEGSFTTT